MGGERLQKCHRVKFKGKFEFGKEMQKQVAAVVGESLSLNQDPREYHRFYLTIQKWIEIGLHQGYVTEDKIILVWERCDKFAGTELEKAKEKGSHDKTSLPHVKNSSSSRIKSKNVQNVQKTWNQLILKEDSNHFKDLKTQVKTRLEFFRCCEAISSEEECLEMNTLWRSLLLGKTTLKSNVREIRLQRINARRRERNAQKMRKMTEEEKIKVKKLHAVHQRQRRLNRISKLSPEGLAEVRKRNAEKERQRHSQRTAKELEEFRQKSAERMREWRRRRRADKQESDNKKDLPDDTKVEPEPAIESLPDLPVKKKTEVEKGECVKWSKMKLVKPKVTKKLKQEENLKPKKSSKVLLKPKRKVKMTKYLRRQDWLSKQDKSPTGYIRVANLPQEKRLQERERRRKNFQRRMTRLKEVGKLSEFKESVKAYERQKTKSESPEKREKRLQRYRNYRAKVKLRKEMGQNGDFTEQQFQEKLKEILSHVEVSSKKTSKNKKSASRTEELVPEDNSPLATEMPCAETIEQLLGMPEPSVETVLEPPAFLESPEELIPEMCISGGPLEQTLVHGTDMWICSMPPLESPLMTEFILGYGVFQVIQEVEIPADEAAITDLNPVAASSEEETSGLLEDGDLHLPELEMVSPFTEEEVREVIQDPLKCFMCSENKFLNADELRSHINASHPEKCWKCPKCLKVVLSPSELLHHFKESHEEQGVKLSKRRLSNNEEDKQPQNVPNQVPITLPILR